MIERDGVEQLEKLAELATKLGLEDVILILPLDRRPPEWLRAQEPEHGFWRRLAVRLFGWRTADASRLPTAQARRLPRKALLVGTREVSAERVLGEPGGYLPVVRHPRYRVVLADHEIPVDTLERRHGSFDSALGIDRDVQYANEREFGTAHPFPRRAWARVVSLPSRPGRRLE